MQLVKKSARLLPFDHNVLATPDPLNPRHR